MKTRGAGSVFNPKILQGFSGAACNAACEHFGYIVAFRGNARIFAGKNAVYGV